MKTRIVRIGNSQGIRIPKPLLAQAGLTGEVELRVTAEGLVIEAADRTRAGWEEAAMKLAADGGGAEDPFLATEFDESDWEW